MALVSEGFEPEVKHPCPWPSCGRRVMPWFWGCAMHWQEVPENLRNDFIRTRVREAEYQPVNHQMAIERINNWLRDNGKSGATGLRPSTATPDLDDEEFTAGWNANGELVLFWARAGEYLVLRAREIKVLRRAVVL